MPEDSPAISALSSDWHSFEGWCSKLNYSEGGYSSSPEPELIGAIVLNAGCDLIQGNTRRSLHSFRFTIKRSVDTYKQNSDASASEVSYEDEAFLFGMRHGCRLFFSSDDQNNNITGELYTSVSVEDFQQFKERAKVSNWVRVTLRIPEPGSAKPLVLVDGHLVLHTCLLDVSFAAASKPSPEWLVSRQSRDLMAALVDSHFGDGQVAYVVKELCVSAVEPELSATSIFENAAKIESIRELIGMLRPAFIEPEYVGRDLGSNLWWLSPREFEKALESRNEEDRRSLKIRHSKLWQHYSIKLTIALGERTSGALKDGLQPNVEHLDAVASTLYSVKGVCSPYLEFLLIDALIYAECIAFAQAIAPSKTILGLSVPAELKPISTKTSFFRGFKQFSVAIFSELMILAVVYFVCSVLVGDSRGTIWLMTSIVMASRWISKAILAQAKQPKQVALELLASMIVAHDLLKTTSFNARALRDALYRVADKGAVFSPWVFNILDARIQRECKKRV